MASNIDVNPSLCVILCISKESSEKSFMYACKLDKNGSIARGNPFALANRKGLHLWENKDITMEGLRVYDVVKYRFSRYKFGFLARTGDKMVSVIYYF